MANLLELHFQKADLCHLLSEFLESFLNDLAVVAVHLVHSLLQLLCQIWDLSESNKELYWLQGKILFMCCLFIYLEVWSCHVPRLTLNSSLFLSQLPYYWDYMHTGTYHYSQFFCFRWLVSCSQDWPWIFYAVEAGFELLILVLLPPKCWNHKDVPWCLASFIY